MRKKEKRYISQREKKKRGDHFGEKRERKRILRREKRKKRTEKEKTRHQVSFFPFCLYIYS